MRGMCDQNWARLKRFVKLELSGVSRKLKLKNSDRLVHGAYYMAQRWSVYSEIPFACGSQPGGSKAGTFLPIHLYEYRLKNRRWL